MRVYVERTADSSLLLLVAPWAGTSADLGTATLPIDRDRLDVREVEHTLRALGWSRSQAKAEAGRCWRAYLAGVAR